MGGSMDGCMGARVDGWLTTTATTRTKTTSATTTPPPTTTDCSNEWVREINDRDIVHHKCTCMPMKSTKRVNVESVVTKPQTLQKVTGAQE